MDQYCLNFAKETIHYWLSKARVLEVGSLNVNGTPRDVIPASAYTLYIGVDLKMGPGVDVVGDVENMSALFNPGSFDVVISMNMLEHVHDWRKAVVQMELMLTQGGILILTVPCPGFEYHPYPEDNFRFTQADMRAIFTSPWDILLLEYNTDTRDKPIGIVPAGLGMVAKLRYDKPGMATIQQRQKWQRHLDGITVMDVREQDKYGY